jgi:hypothetical protein
MDIDSVDEADTRRKDDIHIVFLLTHGFSARTVIRSGLAGRLGAQKARVTVISANANEAYFQRECHTESLVLTQEPKSGGPFAWRFRLYRPYLLDDVLNNPALRIAHLGRRKRHPLVFWPMEVINRTIARSPLFRKFSRALECKANRSREVQQLLLQLQPDLLVLLTPFGTRDVVYLLHARELGIPVVCQMLSWDNITTKGTPLLMPDYFISWGPIMTEELVDLYHFPRHKVYECGVPHFDVYSQKDQLTPRDTLLREIKLPVNHPYIFYGMGAKYSWGFDEIDLLEWLAGQVNGNAFAEPCSLVIRLHPQGVSGFYSLNAKDWQRLRALAGPRVVLDAPPVLSERLESDAPKSDMYHLASLLAGSAMCINVSSTLCLDACMLDRPTITVAFDGWEDLPYEESSRQAVDYIHMAKLLALGGVRIARSFSGLEADINAYLRDPSLDRDGRMLSVARECGPRDGKATERVANTLLQLAGRTQRPQPQLRPGNRDRDIQQLSVR